MSDEKKVNQRESFLFLDKLPVGVVIINAKSHIIEFVNKRAAEMFGQDSDYIEGKECYNFLCPTCRGCCPITDLKETVEFFERIMLCSNGEEKNIIKSCID